MDAKEKEKILETFKKNWLKNVEPVTKGLDWTLIQKNKGKAVQAKPKVATPAIVGTSKGLIVPKQKEEHIPQKNKHEMPETSLSYDQEAKKFKPEFIHQTQQQVRYIKPWYNTSLKAENREIYDCINNIWVIGQRKDIRPIGYHLTALENRLDEKLKEQAKQIEELQGKLQFQEEGFQQARAIAHNMIKYYCTETSASLQKKLGELIKGKNTGERKLQSMVQNVEIFDLIKLRIKDFEQFLNIFKFTGNMVDKIKIEVQLVEMIDLYAQNLLPAEFAIQLLKSVENVVLKS